MVNKDYITCDDWIFTPFWVLKNADPLTITSSIEASDELYFPKLPILPNKPLSACTRIVRMYRATCVLFIYLIPRPDPHRMFFMRIPEELPTIDTQSSPENIMFSFSSTRVDELTWIPPVLGLPAGDKIDTPEAATRVHRVNAMCICGPLNRVMFLTLKFLHLWKLRACTA